MKALSVTNVWTSSPRPDCGFVLRTPHSSSAPTSCPCTSAMLSAIGNGAGRMPHTGGPSGSLFAEIRRSSRVFKPSFAKTSRNFFHNMAKGDASHLSRIAHVLTNHAPTGEYRTRFFPNEPTACPHCDESALQTRRHILTECPWYVNVFPSLTDWGKNRRNDKALMGFLDRNPSAFTFMDTPLDVN